MIELLGLLPNHPRAAARLPRLAR